MEAGESEVEYGRRNALGPRPAYINTRMYLLDEQITIEQMMRVQEIDGRVLVSIRTLIDPHYSAHKLSRFVEPAGDCEHAIMDGE